MPTINANGIEIYHDITGPEDGAPMVLISGVGTQSTRWYDPFVAELAGRGYRVIRMDNRDIGLSTKFTEHGEPDFAEVLRRKAEGLPQDLPYSLSDMAADVVGLLDALGIAQAHVVGASMGGMIAQLVAIEHPARVLSLTSIFSNTGNADLPAGTPEARAALTRPKPDPMSDRDGFLDAIVALNGVIGSPGYPVPAQDVRRGAAADLDRSWHPTGFTRQYAAILATRDRRAELSRLTIPVTVIHGVDDPLVPVTGGRDTAAQISHATLIEIEGMGHNIPPALNTRIIDGIETATRAT
ncbi:alpha/beta fold hydrolase [Pseudooceanicola aestuarii]|uniref:alpha/beta fold hydrolase n=1 Tax=Pseudooceanicola aestuarii TaxID=2697319 RepID=UPI0013D42DE2|nr:alpha/beta hydrolase [Pseudooceanicola aestuarii]